MAPRPPSPGTAHARLRPSPSRAEAGHPPGAPAGSLADLARGGGEVRFRRGDVLWDIGEPADHVLVLFSGSVKLATPRGERDAILDIVSRGGLVGEEAIVPSRRRVVRCVALASGRGARISAAGVHSALRQHDTAVTLLAAATSRSHHFARFVAHAEAGSVARRLARTLLDLSEKFGLPDARGIFVPLRLTRGDFADMTGCRVETATRVLTAWEKEKIVVARREGLVLHDLGALVHIADGAEGKAVEGAGAAKARSGAGPVTIPLLPAPTLE